MGFVAFQLTDEFAGEQEDGTPIYGGGQIATITGETFDVGQELEDGEGIIVLEDNQPVLEQLRALPCLEEVDPPEVEPDDGDAGTVELEDMTVDDLKQLAEARGLTKTGKAAELIERIREYDAAVDAGETPDAESSSASETTTTDGGE